MEIKNIFLISRYSLINTKKQIDSNSDLMWRIVDNPCDCDYFVSLDSVDIGVKIKNAQYILVRTEPSIQAPECYKPRNTQNFDQIIEVGKPNNGRNISIPFPQNLKTNKNRKNRTGNKVAIINSNLFSIRSGELYSLRRKAIWNLEFIDLYGIGWDKSFLTKFKDLIIEVKNLIRNPSKINVCGQINYFFRSSKWHGKVEDKNDVYQNYKYALVIENSFEFISEKIFDALISGCLPIYVGIDLNQFNIPPFLYIKAEPSLDSIEKAFRVARQINYSEWDQKRQSWFNDKETHEIWSRDHFIVKLKQAINFNLSK